MKKINKLMMAAVVAGGMILSSCSITMPVNATSNPVGNKVGMSSGSCIFGYLCFGVDASIQTAAANGGISKISTVDMKMKNLLGIVVTYETIVTGE
jgi:hypothetical protein